MTTGILSSVNLIAGAGILGNIGGNPIDANADLSNAISSYTSVNVVARFATISSSGYVNQNIVANIFPALTNAVPTAYQGILGNIGGNPIDANADLSNAISSYTSVNVVARFATISSSGYVNQNIVANIFPALTNAVPTAYQGSLGSATLTSTVIALNNQLLGNGDLGKFEQVFSSAQALVNQTNQIIKTALNANSSTNTTGFTSQDNLSTGGVSSVSQAFAAFGADLAQLGYLIDLSNLNNLGDPGAVLRQIATVASTTPALNTALLNVGIPSSLVDDPLEADYTDQQQALIYRAMTQITGTELQQILSLLRVTTSGIVTMADLLNPIKIFPRSYNTLTAPTANGLRGIYINSAGAVNSRLETELPASVLAPLTGNPLQNMPGQQT